MGVDELANLDETLREWEKERDFSGVVLVSRGGVPDFQGCYGLADRAAQVPVRPGTRFALASLTKMFTAVAVADQVRSGTVGFDTPVHDVLPPERRPATLRPDVTVAHLLTHTSGIADYAEEEGEDALDYADLWIDRPCYRMLRPADFLPLFGDLPPYRPPGGRFHYSNAGYVLLGLLVEELAGEPYTDVIGHRVFEPAGMTGSGFFPLDEAHPDVAVGYLPPRAPGRPWRTNVYSVPPVGGGDGGAMSTAADLDRFLSRYDDGTLLGRPLRDAMLTARCPVDPGIDMGYGVFLFSDGRFGHGGGDPGVEVLVQRLPQLDTSVIVLCNVSDTGRDLAYEGRALVLDALLA